MTELNYPTELIYTVANFQDLVNAPLQAHKNAACWQRELKGDFEEIVKKFHPTENILVLEEEDLLELELTAAGQEARQTLLHDLALLKEQGAQPVLNLIQYYERDAGTAGFPTDVYSYHVDRSPVPTDTYLCTYYGASGNILPNAQAEQKVLVPEIRQELKKHFNGTEEAFEQYLKEHFLDLHYRPKANAQALNLGRGHLWRLAVDYPNNNALPCVHRAPKEKEGEMRLLLIC